jgi:hypothetical protein
MDAPSSGLISELFLKQIEHIHLAHLSTKHKITEYFRYVDYILLVFDSNHTDIQAILTEFQRNTPKSKVHGTNRNRQYDKLPGHNYPQNSHKLENDHIQESYRHRHDHTIHVKSLHPTQIRSN